MRAVIADLEFVKSGDAHVRITGPVALADEEFASVAQGAVVGLIGSLILITLWLFLAVHTWRLIVPILMTLILGLMLTVLFAAVAVGTLNLVSVGFGVLFVGIAVDFAIQFSVRYREYRFEKGDPAAAMTETARRVGVQILIAALATSAGFLAFVPTDFSGVAELGLIAGAGMIMAFVCTIFFLPAAITVFRPRGEAGEVGFARAARIDPVIIRRRGPDPDRLRRSGRRGRRGFALADLQLRPAGDQEPEHRGDAHPARPDQQPADQPVYDRRADPERPGGGRPRQPAEEAAERVGRDQHQQLRAG